MINPIQKFFIFVLLTHIFYISKAQDEFGGHPMGQNWKIMTSEEVRVIYPEGMEDKANRISNIINYMNVNNRMSIGNKKRKFDLVLQNKTTNPNGYVGLAPLRSEFFATPPQSNLVLGSIDWLDVLAIHEYRHVQQVLNARRGLTKFFYLFGGQFNWAVFNALGQPSWYSEGDAVMMETALTNAGRGRAAFFTIEQRALAYANKNYSYCRHRNGSYVNLIPDQYRLGYMMLTSLRNRSGNDAVMQVMQKSALDGGLLWSFNRAMILRAGLSVSSLYNQSWDDKKAEWKDQLSKTVLIKTTPVTEVNPSTFTKYRYPKLMSPSKIIARKSSYDKTDAIVLIEGGKEQKLTDIGLGIDAFVSEGDSILAWNEFTNNARRGYLDYSDIVLYDLHNNKKRKLTTKARYFSPSVSYDGKKVAAIHITPTQENNVVVLNLESGIEELKLNNPQNYFLSRTAWSEDNNTIVSIAKKDSKLCLIKFDLKENSVTELTPWSHHTLESPFIKDNKVYFNASFSGIDNIYVTDLNGSKIIYQLTSVPIGAFEPFVTKSGNELLFTEFTAMGYHISKQTLNSDNLKSIEIESSTSRSEVSNVAIASEGGNILDKIPSTKYESRPYKGLFKGMKLHSWTIVPIGNITSLQLSLNNIMNDLAITAGAGINTNENNGLVYDADIRFGRYYPEFRLHTRLSDRSTNNYNDDSNTMSFEKFKEAYLGGFVSIPWKWVSGNYFSSFIPSVGLEFRKRFNRVADGIEVGEDKLNTVQTGFIFSKIRRKALQNVGPRAGIIVQANYIKSLIGQSNEKIAGQVRTFFPGLSANHNLSLVASYQKELLSNRYQFSDEFVYSRGYTLPLNDEFSKLSIDYGFPLLYPEFGLLGITYFKRLRANLFYDMGVGRLQKTDTNRQYNSYGVELIFDNTIFNLGLVSLGFRQSFLLNKDFNSKSKSRFQFFTVLDF